jgi:archaellum component FlaF (FlaF/FlaG flagellin family)
MATWGSGTNVVQTPSIIAKEALIALENHLVFAGLVYRAYDKEFRKVGDTITVRKPATFTALKFDRSSGVTLQNITEGSVSVKLDNLVDVTFELTAEQRALDIISLSEQVIAPAMRAHAQYLDLLLAGLYVNTPYYEPADGTDEATKLAEIAALQKILNDNKTPDSNRVCVLSPARHAAYIVLDAFLHAEKRGDTEGLKNANLGRIFGMDFYMDQNIVTHTKGTISSAATATTGTTDTTKIRLIEAGATVVVGDIINVTGKKTYVLLEASSDISSPGVELKCYPTCEASLSANALTVTDTSGANNIAFHKNAYALVTAPLLPPIGGANAAVETYKGLSCRVVYGYDMNKKVDTVSIDMLVGVKTLTEELAVRLIE